MKRARTQGIVTLIVAITISFGLGSCAASRSGAAAACATPILELKESSLTPGGVVRLSADHIRETCEDTGGASNPAADVTVTITPSASGREILLARPVPTGERATVSGSFDLPADLPLGTSVLAVRTHSGDLFSAELSVEIVATTPAA